MTQQRATLRAAVYGRESRDRTKSIEDQVTIASEAVAEQGWTHAGTYDDGTSASRYATKPRPDWDRLLADLDAGAFDVLVLWEATRGDRKLATWATLLDRCRERRVKIHVVSDERTYDPRRSRDYRDLAAAGVDASYETDRSSERVRRGKLAAAKAGRPGTPVPPYGYRKVYDPDTGEAALHLDPETAPTVREIYGRALKHTPVSAITRWLNESATPAPRGNVWYRSRVRVILTNPAYAGYCLYGRHSRGGGGPEQLFPAEWDALVSEEDYWAVQRLLSAPGRGARRPGRVRHLLSYLITCHAGHPMFARPDRPGRWRYTCHSGCASIRAVDLEDFVEAAVVEALATPEVYRRLQHAGEVSGREVQAARGDAARLEATLEDWRASATDGRGTTPESLARVEEDLTRQISAARQRAERAPLPPALRPFAEPGADVEARWADATLQAKREIIRALAVVTVHPASRRGTPAGERVDIEPAGAAA